MEVVRWRIGLLVGVLFVMAVFATGLAGLARQLRTSDLPQPPLKDLAARHHLELGNFAILNHLDDPRYSQILNTQYNLAIIDNTPNWNFTGGGLRPGPAEFNFNDMDKVVAYAKNHHLAIQAHHLLWGEDKWLPDWLKNGNYAPGQLQQIMRDHITAVVGRNKGMVGEWSVVNEAFTRGQHIGGLHDWWADHAGSGYLDQAFIWAHRADPHAKLILNDFDNEHFNPVSDAMYYYIKAAKTRSVPIDGIGMQMHIDGTHPPDKAEVVQNMRRFGALGIQVYVTEFDVNMSAVPVSDQAKDQIAAGIYYNMAKACIESAVCRSFAQLGITDQETWYNYLGNTNDARPLMFDADYQPKPAFYSFRQALSEP